MANSRNHELVANGNGFEAEETGDSSAEYLNGIQV